MRSSLTNKFSVKCMSFLFRGLVLTNFCYNIYENKRRECKFDTVLNSPCLFTLLPMFQYSLSVTCMFTTKVAIPLLATLLQKLTSYLWVLVWVNVSEGVEKLMLIFAHRKIDRGSLKISEVPHMFILYSVFATIYNG